MCALSLGVSSLAKNILVLYFTYSVLYGLGTSFVFSSGINIISKYFKKRRSLAMGILTCGQGAGVLIMAPVLQMMIDAYDWKTTYRIMAGVIFLMCLTALTYSPNVEGEDTEGTPAEEEDKEKGCYIDVSVWKEPKVLVLILSSTIIMFGHYTPQIHLVSLQFNNHKHSSKPKLGGEGDGGINFRASNNSRVVIRGEKVGRVRGF